MAIHPDATVEAGAHVDPSVIAWRGTHVRAGAVIGARTSLGQYVYVGPGAVIGADCKVQNGAYIYEPAVIADGVFVGPRVVLTNDRNPRAISPRGEPIESSDWEAVGVHVERGAAIGAGAVCVAPITIGRWASVAAGAVVVKDVPAFTLVAGVPARKVGWVGRAGVRLIPRDSQWMCPITAELYSEQPDGTLELTRQD